MPSPTAPAEPPTPDALLTEVVSCTDDRVVLELQVTPSLHQPYGIVHGGVYCALAERTATLGARTWLGERGVARATAVGTQFLRAVREGTIRAEATPVHRGRGQQLWQVRMTSVAPNSAGGDDAKATAIAGGAKLVAVSEVRLANLAT